MTQHLTEVKAYLDGDYFSYEAVCRCKWRGRVWDHKSDAIQDGDEHVQQAE